MCYEARIESIPHSFVCFPFSDRADWNKSTAAENLWHLAEQSIWLSDDTHAQSGWQR